MSDPARSSKAVYPVTLHAAIGAMMILSLWGTIRFYRSQDLFSRASRDPHGIEYQQDRFREAVKLLPEGAIVGYLSDLPAVGARGVEVFPTVQYVLAPRLLVEWNGGQRPHWVLGNFLGNADYTALAKSHGLALVKDFGNGVAVFRNPSR